MPRDYKDAPATNGHTRRRGQHRVRFTHNLETHPTTAAAVDVVAEHLAITKTAALDRIVRDWLCERPTYAALIATETGHCPRVARKTTYRGPVLSISPDLYGGESDA